MSVVNSDASVELAKTLEWIREGANQAGAWALEQAPLLAQEFIRWEITLGVLTALVGMVLLLVTVGCLIGAFRSKVDPFGFLIAAFLFGAFGLIPVGHGITRATKAYVAPRVVIVEKIGEIVNPPSRER